MERGSEPAYWPPDDEPDGKASTPPPESEAPTGSRAGGIVAIFASLVVVVIWNAFRFQPAMPEPSPADQDGAARVGLFLAAQAVETHRQTEGALPDSLGQLDLKVEDVEYTASGDGYTLRGRGSTGELSVTSAEAAARLLDTVASGDPEGER